MRLREGGPLREPGRGWAAAGFTNLSSWWTAGQEGGRGATFFAFADTVSARSFPGHDRVAWLDGEQISRAPRSEPNEIIITCAAGYAHLQQQEALGMLGRI